MQPVIPSVLFHGSTTHIEQVDLSFSVPRKDFGQGFYATTEQAQAERFARNKRKQRGTADCYVNVYECRPLPCVNIFQFQAPDMDWLDFVLFNRGFLNKDGGGWPWLNGAPDIIIGPVANDTVGLVLGLLTSGAYGDPMSEDAKLTAIRLLKPEKLVDQVFFATSNAVRSLTFREAIHVA